VAIGDAVPQVYRDLEGIEGAVVVEAPMPAVANSVAFEDPLTLNYGSLDNTFLSAEREHESTYFSIYHWKKLVNGMSGYYPLFYRRALVEMLAFPGPRALAFLRGAGINHIVIHWDYYPPEMREEVRSELAKAERINLIRDYPDGISLYELIPLDQMFYDIFIAPLYTPDRVSPGQPFSSSIMLINKTGEPFINEDESRQHLEAEWRDANGEVVKREETYFFIADGEGAVARFRLHAPSENGSYTLVIPATGITLPVKTWEASIDVGDVPDVDSGLPTVGGLNWESDMWVEGFSFGNSDTWREGTHAIYPGEVFSFYVEAANDGSTQWERERATVEGSVVITAVWMREGDPEYEMIQQGMLPCDMSPGQRAAFPIALQAPTETGSYTLTLRLNCLGIAHIGDPIVIPVRISREAAGLTPMPSPESVPATAPGG
jgi:hypothetical protein